MEKKLIDKIKNMIFKSFTHEMNTPLNGIILNLETTRTIIEQMKVEQEYQPWQPSEIQLEIQAAKSCSLILQSIMNDFKDYQLL